MRDTPLTGPAPTEVPLLRAPLVRVIAQVRFSPILAVQNSEHIAPFQEAIRSAYPVLQQEHAQSFYVGPEGLASGQEPVAWRFSSMDGAWRASLTQDFLALETTSYSSRSDFLARMVDLLKGVHELLDPAVALRIGLRYIAQVTGEPLAMVSKLVQPELLGLTDTSIFPFVKNAMSEAQMEAPEEGGQLRLRWGHLAAGATVDPNAIKPIDEESWVLDIDMWRSKQVSFDIDELASDIRSFSERLYAVFRWSVTDEFLLHYGGTP